jgi:hypothetical protein
MSTDEVPDTILFSRRKFETAFKAIIGLVCGNNKILFDSSWSYVGVNRALALTKAPYVSYNKTGIRQSSAAMGQSALLDRAA